MEDYALMSQSHCDLEILTALAACLTVGNKFLAVNNRMSLNSTIIHTICAEFLTKIVC